MGGRGQFLEKGGFTKQTYILDEYLGPNNNIKIIKAINGNVALPYYSNTSRLYALKDKDGNITQIRVYRDRKAIFDYDFEHHHNGIKPHAHPVDVNDEEKRKNYRKLSKREMKYFRSLGLKINRVNVK